jgi:hypothetical protein
MNFLQGIFGLTTIGLVGVGVWLRPSPVNAQSPQSSQTQAQSEVKPEVKPETKPKLKTFKRQLGDVTAVLSVVMVQDPDALSEYKEARIQISRQGKVVFDQAIADDPITADLEGQWVLAVPHLGADLELDLVTAPSDEFILRDLDGDQEPELMVNFYSGGAHCCSTTAIYRYEPQANRYSPITHFWGNGAGAGPMQDIEGDGTIEFVNHDDRFAYAFASYAGSGYPLQVWNYRSGQMVDVTRKYPKLIYQDAFYWWNAFQEGKRSPDNVEYGKGLLAAYVADKYRLGQGADGWKRAQQAYYGPDKREFFQGLQEALRELGYVGQ